jgi:hypothetical protein
VSGGDERAAFESGRRAGRASGEEMPAPGGEAHIGRASPWIGLICPETHHSFRRGDRVRFGDDLAPRLILPAMDVRAEDVVQFYQGLDTTSPRWSRHVGPDDPLAAPPGDGVPRRACAICGHTFRVFDAVVVCPCDPDRPSCGIAVHQDPARSLVCYDAWRESSLAAFCLANSRPRS